MSVPIITLFHPKGRIGKTSLVYHLSWMAADLGSCVLCADLDPQADLTSAFLDEDRLEAIWSAEPDRRTVRGAFGPLLRGGEDTAESYTETIEERLHLVAGDLALCSIEEELSDAWRLSLEGDARALRITSGFWRILTRAAEVAGAHVVLVDLGSNLGAIQRAALIASDFLVVPMAVDLLALRGLESLGPVLGSWRKGWEERRARNRRADFALPEGRMQPIGYVILHQPNRLDLPVRPLELWFSRIPGIYAKAILGESEGAGLSPEKDLNCLGSLRHYASLIPMAKEAKKPMFHLGPADGALASHAKAAEAARREYKALASRIRERSWGA